MFNIVKRRDFMLADDLPTWRETEELRQQKYGHEYIVVIRADIDPGKEPPAVDPRRLHLQWSAVEDNYQPTPCRAAPA
jgi:hypothetical protein